MHLGHRRQLVQVASAVAPWVDAGAALQQASHVRRNGDGRLVRLRLRQVRLECCSLQ